MKNAKIDFSQAYVTLCPKCLSQQLKAIRLEPHIRFECKNCKHHFNLDECKKQSYNG